MSDFFVPTELEEIICTNRELCEERQEYFSVDKELLNKIFQKVNTCNGSIDQKKRVIKRAAYILSLITNLQPFHECNRHIAFSVTISFLRRNGLNLPLNNTYEEKIIFNVVDRAKNKKENDPTLCSEVETFLESRAVSYNYRRYY